MSGKNPFLGLGLGSPFLSFARPIESGGGGDPVGQIDTSAAHFWDFSSTQSSPFEDQRGSLEFTVNTSSMATGNSTYGNPPGWSNGAGFFASSGSLIQTAADACFDLSGDFCIEDKSLREIGGFFFTALYKERYINILKVGTHLALFKPKLFVMHHR